ncbi:MAG: bacterioferritin [Deltaproteobacteria bacterium]|nr:bacterioferritin [Deltaproteobacteria bacterium]
MKGQPEIVALLNEVLGGELVAISQYFVHAKMCKNWGYDRLAGKIRSESIEEMRHAEELTDRILFLEGVPNFQKLGKLNIGENVKEQFESDLALEMRAHKVLNDGIELCRQKGDNASEALLRKILVNEEDHIDWIETQLDVIQRVGLELYLSQQLAG